MPRAKTYYFLLSTIILLVSGMFLLSRIPKKETVQSDNRAVIEATAKAVEILAKDSDNDNLKDWEEELWKTDGKNPDTDGDGTNDGDEIRLGRDPLKPGPNDLLEREDIENKTTITKEGDRELTLSERIARELFAQYMAAKQSGKPFTAENEKQILLHFFNNPPPLASATKYNAKDLPASEGGTEGLHTYGNKLAETLLKYVSEKNENELLILEDAVNSEDESKLDKLAVRHEIYQKAIKDLLVLPTPLEIAHLHIELINSISAMDAGVTGMQIIFKDPVKSLETIGQYPQGIDGLYATINAIGRFLIEKEIKFTINEPGMELIE